MPLRTQPTISLLRLAVLLILWVGLVGIEIELLLLKHTDGRWQLLPVVLSAATMLLLVWYAIARSAASLRALQAMMLVFLATGALGVYQHFEANTVYERESDPSLAGFAVYTRAAMGATPTLAPGVLVQLALLGLAFTFRHPNLTSDRSDA